MVGTVLQQYLKAETLPSPSSVPSTPTSQAPKSGCSFLSPELSRTCTRVWDQKTFIPCSGVTHLSCATVWDWKRSVFQSDAIWHNPADSCQSECLLVQCSDVSQMTHTRAPDQKMGDSRILSEAGIGFFNSRMSYLKWGGWVVCYSNYQ